MSKSYDELIEEQEDIRKDFSEILEQDGTDKDSVFNNLMKNLGEISELMEKHDKLRDEFIEKSLEES